MILQGQIVDIKNRCIYKGEITIDNNCIKSIEAKEHQNNQYILPGFIDAHIHIESSMLTPGAFATVAVSHGTVAVVSDPHEIANVLGRRGVEFMLTDAERVPMKFMFGAPSAVPATPFESSGATINSKEVDELLSNPNIGFLSEMMNYPGVINSDEEVFKKIEAAKRYGKPVDGHAPGVTGDELKRYVEAGISTDHECNSLEEAREKISLGMKIMIREGSAARNLSALHPLLAEFPDMVMLCSDDLHPDDLIEGHINLLVSRLMLAGYNPFDVLRAACVNAVEHFNLPVGLLRVGDCADFIIVESVETMSISSTWIAGKEVFSKGRPTFDYAAPESVNKFNSSNIGEKEIAVDVNNRKIRVIEVFDGDLFTKERVEKVTMPLPGMHDVANDILKVVVKDRYRDALPAIGFVKGFGIREGAFASSVAHDSHNIIAVGTSDKVIVKAINKIVEMKGGLSWCVDDEEISLPLDIAGIISSLPANEVAARYERLTEAVRNAGSDLQAPYMTLSFIALLVIPELKIGDRGLFDVRRFSLVPLIVD